MRLPSKNRSCRLCGVVLLILLQQIQAQSTAQQCFADLGSCSQQCTIPLYEATGCGCNAVCLCNDITYLYNVAAAVASCCSAAELNSTIATAYENCVAGGVVPTLSEAQYVEEAKAAASTCTVAGLATSKTSSPSATSSAATGMQYPSSERLAH